MIIWFLSYLSERWGGKIGKVKGGRKLQENRVLWAPQDICTSELTATVAP